MGEPSSAVSALRLLAVIALGIILLAPLPFVMAERTTIEFMTADEARAAMPGGVVAGDVVGVARQPSKTFREVAAADAGYLTWAVLGLVGLLGVVWERAEYRAAMFGRRKVGAAAGAVRLVALAVAAAAVAALGRPMAGSELVPTLGIELALAAAVVLVGAAALEALACWRGERGWLLATEA